MLNEIFFSCNGFWPVISLSLLGSLIFTALLLRHERRRNDETMETIEIDSILDDHITWDWPKR